MKAIELIRQGQCASLRIPRSQWAKLWAWCRKHSELDGHAVNVCRYEGLNYEPNWIQRKRMGRAVPELRVHHRWNESRGCYVVHFTSVRWSYVF